MATISSVRFTIEKGGDTRSTAKRRVRVTYTVHFNSSELLAGSVFRESVNLRADDLIDNHIINIFTGPLKATAPSVNRSINAEVSRSRLDEDGDTIILGWVVDAAQDEIYARVELSPFVPSGASADSNIVKGQFGAAGND